MKNNYHIVLFVLYEFSENMALLFHSPALPHKRPRSVPFWTQWILKLRHRGMPNLKTWFVFLIEFWFIGRVFLAEGKRRLWLNSTTMRCPQEDTVSTPIHWCCCWSSRGARPANSSVFLSLRSDDSLYLNRVILFYNFVSPRRFTDRVLERELFCGKWNSLTIVSPRVCCCVFVLK